MSQFKQFLDTCRDRVDLELQQLLPVIGECNNLQAAMRYSIFNGGKRVRPVLVYAAAQAIAIDYNACQSACDTAAAAAECIHAYSLIHDDLPAMDDDDLRRGKPTCHIAFDEASAILAGDALQCLAFEALGNIQELADSEKLAMVLALAKASGDKGMVAGQAIDLGAVDSQLSLQELQNMHGLKTGALIRASVELGARATGEATTKQLQQLDRYACAIGLAFQVQDDILDVTASTETLGKQQGADLALNKPTYVSLLGLEVARAKAQDLHRQALAALDSFGERAEPLRQLSEYIISREH